MQETMMKYEFKGTGTVMYSMPKFRDKKGGKDVEEDLNLNLNLQACKLVLVIDQASHVDWGLLF